jgi:aminoglycoside phosphotransferase (APT) family kinase protein
VSSPPRPIAAGRASEIFDLGGGRILRRFKGGGHPEREALVMRHARGHGYPVPRVLEVRAEALVLEKVDGPTMWEAMRSERSKVPRHAATLAHLHRELHEIDAPQGVPAVGDGNALLHLDLHPANVILSPDGPVVIDWTNARGGDPLFDVAVTWIIGATSTGLGRTGDPFLRHFLAEFERAELRSVLRAAAGYRGVDRNVTNEERRAIAALVAEELG